jgi:hypothetical protein
MKKRTKNKFLISFFLALSFVLATSVPSLATEQATELKAADEPVSVVEGPGGPSVPGKQEADPNFSGKVAVVVAGVPDDNGNLAIHFSKVTVAKLLVSKKALKVDMPAADLTLSADNVREIISAAGDVFTLQLSYDKANKVGNRTAVTDQISFGIKNVGGNSKSVDFSPAAKLAFKVSSNAKNLQGVRKASNGQWKNVAGKKTGGIFTISMKELGSYTVVSN